MKDLESAVAALYEGGWRYTDREQLKKEYDLTEDEANILSLKLLLLEPIESED